MKKIGWKARARYAFDNTMSAGTIALIGWLAIFSLLIILAGTLLLFVFGVMPDDFDGSFVEAFWQNAMRAIDPGTVAGDSGWGFRVVGFLVTVGGIFIVSTFIGVLTSGIEQRIEDLRKGRSFVIEKDHTLILGWSPKIFSIITELAIANENIQRPRIVILANKDKVEMEDEIREKVEDLKNTRVICRTGVPSDMSDLEIVNPRETKSIILLSGKGSGSDSNVIKNILAIANHPERRPEPYHIVAELNERKNIQVAKLVGKDELEVIQPGDMIARIMVQTCRQSGLSLVYNEILGYAGDEIYFQEEPTLTGKTFHAAIHAYEDSAVIGLMDDKGKVMINPPMSTEIKAGYKICAISEDDDTVKVSNNSQPLIKTALIRTKETEAAQPEKILILGWHKFGRIMIEELDGYVEKGSEVLLVSMTDEYLPDPEVFNKKLKNISLNFIKGDTTDREVLERLNVPQFNEVIIVCYRDVLEPNEADAHTLLTLLHLRDIAEQSGSDFSIVTEMLDIRNRDLAEVTKADDFIVSDKIVSLLLAQISEDKNLAKVFAELFDADGSEIYLKPASEYVATGESMNFYTVTEAACQKNEIAIGYRLMKYSDDARENYGVKVNPVKSAALEFTSEDRIIVISRE